MLKCTNLSHIDKGSTKIGEIVHLKLEGRLDSQTAKTAQEEIERIIEHKNKFILMLDLSGLEFISSLGIRTTFILAQNVKKKQSKLLLTNVNENISSVFELAGLLPNIAKEGRSAFQNTEEADAYLEEIESRKLINKTTKTLVLV